MIENELESLIQHKKIISNPYSQRIPPEYEKTISLKSNSGKKSYKPKKGSGAYSLLMGLFKYK